MIVHQLASARRRPYSGGFSSDSSAEFCGAAGGKHITLYALMSIACAAKRARESEHLHERPHRRSAQL
jgi:hypothetical protein